MKILCEIAFALTIILLALAGLGFKAEAASRIRRDPPEISMSGAVVGFLCLAAIAFLWAIVGVIALAKGIG